LAFFIFQRNYHKMSSNFLKYVPAWSSSDTRIPSELFLDSQLSGKFECPICLSFVRNPVQCENEHVFCEPCILKYLDIKQECACCKTSLTKQSLRKLPRLVTSIMNELRVKCPMFLNQQLSSKENEEDLYSTSPPCKIIICDWIGTLADINHHLDNDCEYCKRKCRWEGCTERLSPNDIRSHESNCDYRIDTCRNNDDIHIAVNAWCTNEQDAERQYGPISSWDTSAVTIMKGLFEKKKDFNADIST